MRSNKMEVLLVGTSQWSHRLAEFLEKRGYECIAVESAEEVRALFARRAISLVLGQLMPRDGWVSLLIDGVAGFPVNMYLCMKLEDKTLWLPAVKDGCSCWGSPALSPAELTQLLQQPRVQDRARGAQAAGSAESRRGNEKSKAFSAPF